MLPINQGAVRTLREEMKKFLLALLCLGLVGCATTEQFSTKPSGNVITQSSGSLDMTKFKEFAVAYTSQPGSVEALRDSALLRHIVYRLEQEGFKYTPNPQDADVIAMMTFLDAHGQRYVPPVAYTTVSYDSNTDGTFNALGTSMGNFMTINGTTNTQTEGTATATTHVEGGYYLPTYGVGIALNVYDTKTKELLWYGVGVRQANFNNSNPAINDIVLTLIDKDLITPSYIAGKRQEIREKYLNRLPSEYLMGKSSDGNPRVNVINNIEDGVKIMTKITINRGPSGELLYLNVIIDNQSNHELTFDPKDFKVSLDGEDLSILSKSKVVEYVHNLKKNNVAKVQAYGLLGIAMASVYNGIQEHSAGENNQVVDNEVKMVFNNYLDKTIIPSKGHLATFAYITGFTYLPDNSKVTLHMPLNDKVFDLDYTYVPNWMSESDYQKALSKK